MESVARCHGTQVNSQQHPSRFDFKHGISECGSQESEKKPNATNTENNGAPKERPIFDRACLTYSAKARKGSACPGLLATGALYNKNRLARALGASAWAKPCPACNIQQTLNFAINKQPAKMMLTFAVTARPLCRFSHMNLTLLRLPSLRPPSPNNP